MASGKFNIVKANYMNNTWGEDNVQMAVDKGWITQAEKDEIVAAKEAKDAESAERKQRIRELYGQE